MKRSLVILAVILLSLPFAKLFAQNFVKNEYQKALWMTTRMYGGQRSGEAKLVDNDS
ncbi:MAG: hypothetical protein IPO21_08485 [Bacteroidales bacterium]|nr:hypothetical protein [Bacteroidales bacterium]